MLIGNIQSSNLTSVRYKNIRMASPPSGKEGWLKAGVVGAPIL